MEFGSRRGPLHPELAVWRSCPHGELAEEEEEEEKKEKKKECTFVRDPHLAGGEILGKKTQCVPEAQIVQTHCKYL